MFTHLFIDISYIEKLSNEYWQTEKIYKYGNLNIRFIKILIKKPNLELFHPDPDYVCLPCV